MGNIFKEDFRDFINALNTNNVRYVLVGGYSVILHGHPRTTGDMDIWVERTLGNYHQLRLAFLQFGMPLFDMTQDRFLNDPLVDVFTFGRPPVAIDIMVSVLGLDFDTCFNKAIYFKEDDLQIRTIHIMDLIDAKKASARSKDLDDLENLNPLL